MSAKLPVEDIDGVLIVGAGPVGLFAALKLARMGIRAVVLDTLEEVIRSPRAAGYQWPLPKLLEDVGVLDDALAVGVVKRANQFRRPATGQINTLSLGVLDTEDEFPLDLQLGQDVLADIMLRHVNATGGAEVRWKTEVTEVEQNAESVTITVQGPDGTRQLRAPWLFATDGARSTVRDKVGITFSGHTWPEGFVATNVYYDFEAYGYGRATFVRDPVNWAVIIKLTRDGMWRIAYGEDPSFTEDQVRANLPERYRAFLPGREPYQLETVRSYRVHERAADRLREGRVLLAGDSAHICNPAGGYGLMGGLMSADTLCRSLSLVLSGEAGEEVLDRYSEERLRIYHELISPSATEYKRVLQETDPEQMRRDDEQLLKVCTVPEISRKATSFSQSLL